MEWIAFALIPIIGLAISVGLIDWYIFKYRERDDD